MRKPSPLKLRLKTRREQRLEMILLLLCLLCGTYVAATLPLLL